MSTVTLLTGDVIDVLKTLPDQSVHACLCSPPFFGLRDYGTGTWQGGDPNCKHTVSNQVEDRKAKGAITNAVRPGAPRTCRKCGALRIDRQIGLENSVEEYVTRLVEVFREVRRVLRNDGTLWLNLGESFASKSTGSVSAGTKQRTQMGSFGRPDKISSGFKPKDLMMIPARVAIALQSDGWYLRQDIIWAKSNKMPESVKDRPTINHEHIFLLAKSRRYFYDGEAVKEDGAGTLPWGNKRNFKMNDNGAQGRHGSSSMFSAGSKQEFIDKWYSGKRQRRSVWNIPTKPYKGAHFATWPEALVEIMLLAATSEKGCCPACGAPYKRIVEKEMPPLRKVVTAGPVGGHGLLGGNRFDDPIKTTTTGWQPSCKCPGDLEPGPCTAIDIFSGAGTTGVVCVKHNRNYIGIDLNPSNHDLARERIAKVQPLFMEVL